MNGIEGMWKEAVVAEPQVLSRYLLGYTEEYQENLC